MFLLIGYDTVKVSVRISHIKIKPSTTFVLSFLTLILIGTGVLCLPAMTVAPGGMPFLDALFTATSATCVTGLIVVDTATYFTTRGQAFIILLVQLGGLGIISFASFFATFLRQGVGIKQQALIQDYLSSESLLSAQGLLKRIILMTLSLEFITFLLVYFSWGDIPFDSVIQKVFFSAFHAISAFCNAGFSLYSDNLYQPGINTAYIIHLIIIASVILGGIGFSTLEDLFSIRNLRDRLKNTWRDWKVSTKIAVYTSATLLLFGSIVFYLLEKDNTLAGLNIFEALLTSFFQSGSARTAGFNTVDFGELRNPTLIMIIFLMFIGASSGSVGGGIKTSTFYLIVSSVIATLRGRLKIEIGKRFIPKELLFKALSIFFFAATINLIGIFALTLFEPEIDVLELVFEQVSAFGTVGLSTGITAELSTPSRFVLMISMFLGRVGILTFALALSTRMTATSYKYPKAHLMIG